MKLEAPVPDAILADIRAPFAEAGAARLEAPIAQPLGLYLDIAGEGLRERLFVVQGARGDEECLRPDFTVAAVTAHMAQPDGPRRYFYEGHAFRVAPPGADRAEQFLQMGLESFGEPAGGSPEGAQADAAMAAVAWRAAIAGGRDDLRLILGDVALFAAFLGALNLERPLTTRLTRALSNPRRLRMEIGAGAEGRESSPRTGGSLALMLAPLSEADAGAVMEDIWALAGIEPVGGRSAAEIVARLTERGSWAGAPRLNPDQAKSVAAFLAIGGEPRAALAEAAALAGKDEGMGRALAAWDLRLDVLARLGAPAERMRLETGFGRAFGYYDGALFEVRSAALGDDQPVAAGGRYDSLPSRLGGTSPAGAKTGGALGCMVRPYRAWRDSAP